MKILLSTYSAAGHSSYGLVTRELWKRLSQMHPNWHIYQHGWHHRRPQEEVPWTIEPTNFIRTPDGMLAPDPEDIWGQKTFRDVVRRFKPDVVWSLGDPYMMDHVGQYRPNFGFRSIKYCPADGSPQPPAWGDAMKDCDMFVPLSKYAARVFHSFYPDQSLEELQKRVIYHGVDADRFFPADPERKALLRPKSGAATSKSFVLGFNGHNQYRKQTWNLFLLLAYLRTGSYWVDKESGEVLLDHFDDIDRRFVKSDLPATRGVGGPWVRAEPRDVILWMHCFRRGDDVDYPPDRVKEFYNVGDSVSFTSSMGEWEGVKDDEMPSFYQGLDAYVSLSGGEGFNIPLIESGACGVPVIYTDYSAQPEVAEGYGLPVRPYIIQRQQRNLVGRCIADMGHAVQQVRRLMDDRDLYQELAQTGVRLAREKFSWDVVAQQWSRAIDSNFAPRRIDTMGVSL